ncbi:MAG: hypothetical protein AAFO95_15245, partial [Cyanobacteria bacterium J06600_6]
MSIKLSLKYLTAISIALSLQSGIKAQSQTDSLGNLRQRLTSEWEGAVLTHSLASATEINAIEFSPNGKLLASVGASQISIWNVETGEIQRVLPGHYASEIKLEIAPTAIAFSPDSQYLASATWSQGLLSPDQSIVVRDLSTGKVKLKIADADGCRQIAFDPIGEMIYGACGFGVTAWSFPTGEKLFSFDTEYAVEAIALSPDGKVMATVDANVSAGQQGERSNQIQLWQIDSDTPKLLSTLDGHANDIAQLRFTADGDRLVSSSYDGKINVWNWQQGTRDRRTNNLQSDDGIFSLSANSQLIAGNFHSSTMTNLQTGLPLINVMKLPRSQRTGILAFNPQTEIFARVQNKIDGNSQIDLWSAEATQISPSQRDNYRSLAIAKYWTNQIQTSQPLAKENIVIKPASIGTDIKEIALSALGLVEIVESEQEEVQVEYPHDDSANVTITQTN